MTAVTLRCLNEAEIDAVAGGLNDPFDSMFDYLDGGSVSHNSWTDTHDPVQQYTQPYTLAPGPTPAHPPAPAPAPAPAHPPAEAPYVCRVADGLNKVGAVTTLVGAAIVVGGAVTGPGEAAVGPGGAAVMGIGGVMQAGGTVLGMIGGCK